MILKMYGSAFKSNKLQKNNLYESAHNRIFGVSNVYLQKIVVFLALSPFKLFVIIRHQSNFDCT